MAIVGLDVEQNVPSPSFALISSMGSSITRISLAADSLGKEEATWSPSDAEKNPGQAWSISVHPDPTANLFATAGLGGTVRILSSAVDTFGEEKATIASRGDFASAKYSPNGRMLATAMSNGQLALYDADTYQLVQYWTGEL